MKKTLLISISFFVIFPLFNMNAIAGPKVALNNFRVVSFHLQWRDRGIKDGLYAVGEIQNIGNIAAGFEVEVIIRDKNGTLIASDKFWPNSIRNVAPGSSCGIDHMITEDRRAAKGEVKVINTEIWD